MATSSLPTKPRWKRILLWCLGLSIGLPVIVILGWYLYWFSGFFDLGRERLSFTEPCGDYRLNYYLTEKGNGRIEYAHKSGEVYGKYPMTPQTEPAPIWDADCKGVKLGVADYSKYFKATK